MEGSESEAIFDFLNLNPRLFVNEVLNMVDDVVDDAFDFFYQEALVKLNSEGTERSQNLRKGVDCIRNVIQAVLDKRLAIWEKYCLRHCFSVPQSFVMPKSDNSIEDGSMGRALSDPEIELQLNSLREELTEVGKESELLNKEFQALQMRHSSESGLINETLQFYDQDSMHELFQEIVTTASELGTKVGKLKTRMAEQTEQMNVKGISIHIENLSATDYAKGLSNVKFEDLQGFSTVVKNI
ncbi:protein MIS12 homolog [Prosopis cineraria]|uniref:protein MIS12 homolog n=1 Tax=Prosopis cineraria TaxID=364024 RepID=UPI00240FD6D6|nr:protein MIS12 homolog [Prosopis cineraria]